MIATRPFAIAFTSVATASATAAVPPTIRTCATGLISLLRNAVVPASSDDPFVRRTGSLFRKARM